MVLYFQDRFVIYFLQTRKINLIGHLDFDVLCTKFEITELFPIFKMYFQKVFVNENFPTLSLFIASDNYSTYIIFRNVCHKKTKPE